MVEFTEPPEDHPLDEVYHDYREEERLRNEATLLATREMEARAPWPDSPPHEVVKYSAAGQAKRFAIVRTEDGAELMVEAAYRGNLEPDRVNFILSTGECLRLSDALSNIVGRLTDGCSEVDTRFLEYLLRAEKQLRENAEYLARLPVNVMTAEQILATRAVLNSKP